MKKLIFLLLGVTVFLGTAAAQEKRPPEKELKAQTEHVKSSGNDLLHLRFKKAHESMWPRLNGEIRGLLRI